MAKRKLEDDNELSGFVHDLTPLKVSRTNAKYFNCILQTDTSEYKRVVCFDSVKRSLFENAEQTKSPVKLKDVKEVPSKDNNSPDIMVNSKSDLQSIKATKLDFNHHPRSRQEVKTAEICIKDVQTLPEKTMVSTSGVVTNMKTPTVQIVYGTPTNQQDTVISDSSGFTELVLWGSLVNAVDVNKSYRIKNVSTRYYKGRRHLTTTKTSTITEIDGIEHVQVPENPYANITTITGSVTEVRVNKTLMCNSCTKKTVSIDETCKFARCPNCGMNQLTKTYTSCISATLNVKSNGADGKKEKLVLFDTVLNNYLVVQQKEGLINDAPRLEEYFLEANALTFEYSEQDNIVHSIRNN